MYTTESLFPLANSNGRIECREILGGIRDKDIEVSAGKVIASVYSSACCGGRGGDIYYFGVCKDGLITRLAIADVTGHGQSVSKISRHIYDALKYHI